MQHNEAALQKVRADRLLIDRVDQWLYEEIEPYLGQRVLEIGCGLGNFSRYFTDRQLYIGTDIAAESVNRVNETYAQHPHIVAYVMDASSEAMLQLAKYELDTVFSLNVFEHIEDDVGALQKAASLLQPGGNLVLVVPAHDILYGRIDEAIGHYRRYSKGPLASIFEDLGLRVVVQKHINMLGAIGWFVSARLLRHETPPSGQLRLFNQLVPALMWLERSLSVPFGVSLLTVGKRPE